MPSRLPWLSILSLLALTLVSVAADKPEKWIEVRSPNFTVVTNAGEKQGRRIAEEFEAFRGVIQKVLPQIRVDPGQPVIVLAVKDEKSLKRLLPAFWETKGRSHPAGVFLEGPEKHYAALRIDATGGNPFHVLYHEYVHLLVKVNFEWIPLWLNEGLAEFYANAVFEGMNIGLGRPSESHIYLLQEKKLLPIEELLRVDHSSPHYNEANKTSVFYAQSWALTHYLLLGDKTAHAPQLQRYLNDLQRGASERQAAEKAFGDLKKFEKALRNYVGMSRFYYIPTQPPSDIDEKTFQARELTPAEAKAVAGDFYARTRRPVEARAELEQAMALDPRLAAPRESMGFLCQMEGNNDEALRWFAEAVQLDSKSFLAHYLHAMLSSRGGLDPERMQIAENGLKRAIELNPKFAPAYSTLAGFYAGRDEKLSEALALAKKAVALEPGMLMHHLTLANVLLRMERVDEARNIGQRVLAAARNEFERMAAQSFLQSAASYQDYLARKKRDEEERAQYEQQRARYEEELRKAAETERQEREAQPAPAGGSTTKSKAPRKAPMATGPTTPGEGRVVQVTCEGPALDVTLEYLGEKFALHSENYFQVEYLTLRWQPPAHFNPCQHLKGRQVKVEYRVVVGRPYAGELISVEVVR